MVNLGRFCGITTQMQEKEAREKEAKFVERLLDEGVFVAPETQYHHPKAGWFRFTFSMEPRTLKLALERMERAMHLEERWEQAREVLDLEGKGPRGEQRKSWLQKISGR